MRLARTRTNHRDEPPRSVRASVDADGLPIRTGGLCMSDTDAYDNGADETRQDFTDNDFRIKRLLNSLVSSAKGIRGDEMAASDIAARVDALRHLLKQVGHGV